ncbi:MAG: Uncharacterized protein XD95_0228 [Microgenomates bacterium 39_7]|nr:MAG: Uncharacterized protein XD95_0228 [Microgenomates bacterium 39_7]
MAENTNPSQPTSTKSKKGNTSALLCYAVGWITGLIFLLTEKEDKFIRFHAAQSLLVFGALNLITFIPIIGWMLAPLLVPIGLILWILLMLKAYQGERFKLPVVGDYAEKVMEKIK